MTQLVRRHAQDHLGLLGERFTVGVVLYLGREPLSLGDRLVAVPLSAFWQHAPLS